MVERMGLPTHEGIIQLQDTQGVFYSLHPSIPKQTAVVAHRNIDIHRNTDIHQRRVEITSSRTHYLPQNAVNTTNYTTHSNIIGGDKQSPITGAEEKENSTMNYQKEDKPC